MKAITLHQPWASLVAVGAKRYETRSWTTSYRGPLAIHASRTFPAEGRGLLSHHEPRMALLGAEPWFLPLGSVVAVAQLVDVVQITSTDLTRCGLGDVYKRRGEFLYGDFRIDRYAWVLDQVQRIEPVPARGSLGLWEWGGAEWLRPSRRA